METRALRLRVDGQKGVMMGNEAMEPRRFAAYKIYIGTQNRTGFVENLTLEEARDERRFPLGLQTDAAGQFVWAYGLNGGQKIV